MSKKTYDIVVKVGEYEKDGETKGRYINVGSILKNNEGKSFIIMDRTFNPAGVPNPEERATVLLSLFEPKKKEEKAASQGEEESPI